MGEPFLTGTFTAKWFDCLSQRARSGTEDRGSAVIDTDAVELLKPGEMPLISLRHESIGEGSPVRESPEISLRFS